MWNVKRFKTRAELNEWLSVREKRIQWSEIFVENGYAVEWRLLSVANR